MPLGSTIPDNGHGHGINKESRHERILAHLIMRPIFTRPSPGKFHHWAY
jgi:hypothetical protein